MQNEHDATLVAAARAGEPDAIEAIYRHYAGLARSVALTMMGDATVADDMTGDAWLKLLRALPCVAPDTNLGAFISVVVRNRCLDELRQRQRNRWLPWDASMHEPLLASPYGQPAAECMAAETAAEVRAALGRIDRRSRTSLLLVMDDCLPLADIGDALGLSRSAVKSLLYRSRAALRAVMVDAELTGVAW